MNNPMILLFGATGDLAKKKLLPALFTLYKKKKLIDTPIVAIGRRQLTKQEYSEEMHLQELEKKDSAAFHIFLNNLHYHAVDIKDKNPISFINVVHDLDKKHQCQGRKIAYLATSYELFSTILDFLKNANLLDAQKTIIAFEKPFGFNQSSARKLQKDIAKRVHEKNVYRVDHYLAKNMVDNLLTLRLENPLFSNLWYSKSIDNVQIIAVENFGVEGRGEYYDQSGAIRDLVQNHLLQIIALVAMELPKTYEAEAIRNEKLAVLKKLQVPRAKEIVKGQYEQYTNDSTIKPNSQTETFVAFKTLINTPRWKNVPFYVKTGKYLDKKCSEINIVLKKNKDQKQNVISIRLGPDQEGIALQIVNKAESNKTRQVSLEYCHKCEFGPNTPEAYERIFSEILSEDQTLFPRSDEVDTSWKFTDKLIKVAKKTPLHVYKRNISDLQASKELLAKDKREWVYVERKITI